MNQQKQSLSENKASSNFEETEVEESRFQAVSDIVAEAFQTCDSDADGQLNYAEFVKWAQANTTILEELENLFIMRYWKVPNSLQRRERKHSDVGITSRDVISVLTFFFFFFFFLRLSTNHVGNTLFFALCETRDRPATHVAGVVIFALLAARRLLIRNV